MREIGIALLGLGNVGLGTYRILEAHATEIERRLGARVRVRWVLVRQPDKTRPGGPPPDRLTTHFEKILGDPQVAVVVELLGGVEPARDYLLRAMSSGRHVVTANKALLAGWGEELFQAALGNSVDLQFEAAVCGGIPIIRTLREGLASDRVESLYGIVNGTTNLILSSMGEEGMDYDTALKRAQKLGFAEADPTLDVTGVDAAQKLCLLTRLAFMARVSTEQVSVEGIGGLRPIDFQVAREFGYVIKLLAVARRDAGHGLDVRVHPAFIPQTSPLAEVRGGFNAVFVTSAALGPALFYGQGAGAMPTGSAVVADVIDTCRNLLAGVSGRLPMLCAPHLQDLPLRERLDWKGRYYLGFTVADQPGVLGRIAGVLGARGVSIATVVQRPPAGDKRATITLFTHRADEASVRASLEEVDADRCTLEPTRLVRIEEEPPLGPAAR